MTLWGWEVGEAGRGCVSLWALHSDLSTSLMRVQYGQLLGVALRQRGLKPTDHPKPAFSQSFPLGTLEFEDLGLRKPL